MVCKHNNLSMEEALNRGWCKTCRSLDCVKVKEHNTYCHKCGNTGISDIINDDPVICNNCIWGIEFAIEQQEWQKVGYAGLERMINE